MELPSIFEKDIQLKTLNIITRVVIGEEDPIYLSTHSLNFDGQYYKPLLLGIPSMKESVDYESRNFKISNVTLNISNYKIKGERFSDTFKNNPLINKIVEVFWNTQSAKTSEDTLLVFKGYVRRVSHTDSTVNIQLEDLTQSKLHKSLPYEKTSTSKSLGNKYRGVPIPMAFGYLENAPAVLDAGNILKADSDDSVELITEDSENYQAHQVWGEFQNYDDSGGYSSVRMVLDDEILYIPLTVKRGIRNDNTGLDSPKDHIQYDFTSVEQSGTVKINPFIQVGTGKVLQGICPTKPSGVSCTYRSSASLANHDGMRFIVDNGPDDTNDGNSGWETPERFNTNTMNSLTDDDYAFNDLINTNGYYPFVSYSSDEGDNPSFDYTEDNSVSFVSYAQRRTSQGLIRVSLKSSPNFPYTALSHNTHIAINGHPIDIPDDKRGVAIYSRTLDTDETYSSVPWSSFIGNSYEEPLLVYLDGFRINTNSDGSNGDFHQDYRNIFEFTYDGEPDTNTRYRGNDTLTDGAIRISDIESTRNLYSGFVRITDNTDDLGEINITVGAFSQTLGGLVGYEIGLEGDWSELDILQVADVEFKNDSSFVLSVNGRRDGEMLIRNPMEAIKNIAINDLGLIEDIENLENSQIDNDSYDIAFAIHDDLKFDFSVYKQIESKKLFEDIAKSTLCYPYFNNQGKLKFASYKPTYTIDDYNIAKSIKDFDVIGYSFNKTKLEQVYTRIEFHYSYNYITEKYDKVLESGVFPSEDELKYNGYEDVDDNVLKFESPYIRDDDTAEKVWQRMFRFYKNQHLTCKLKLPLHYIDLQVGDVIKFDKLLGDIKAFGIDYTKVVKLVESSSLATSAIYPLFFITSINKNLDSIEIEAQQIHNLGGPTHTWGDLHESEEDLDEDFTGEIINGFEINPESSNPFFTTEGELSLSTESINLWLEPSTFGLDSFNSLIPSSFDSYTENEVNNYEALRFTIATNDENIDFPAHYTLSLKNIGNENFEFAWTVNGDLEGEDSWVEWFDPFPSDQRYITDFNSNFILAERRHKLHIGDGLKKAMNLNLVSVDDLTFQAGVNIVEDTSVGSMGDVNQDGTLNILDVVTMVNIIMGEDDFEDTFQEDIADINQDGTANILDIIQLVNIIFGA